MQQLPPEAIDALENGNMIEAIKIVRDRTGLDLKESKEAVDRYAQGERGALLPDALDFQETRPVFDGKMPPPAQRALEQGNKIEAIRIVREMTGMGLGDAKTFVEEAGTGADDGSTAFGGVESLRDPMHEPGRVRGGGAPRWLLAVVVLVAAVLAWMYSGGRL